MNASPPILQIHLLLNVLNRFAFTPGLGEREQAGLECLGDYLVAVHRLQSARASAVGALETAVLALLALNQWLREDVAPTVSVRSVDVSEDRLRPAIGLVAARVQAALMLLDGRAFRAVAIELIGGLGQPGDAAAPAAGEVVAGPGIRVVVSVSFASSPLQPFVSPASPASLASASHPSAGVVQDGVDWVEVSGTDPHGFSMRAELEVVYPD
ncbi:MAG: hypothetical protein JWQ11_4771 [Rhizobacter sp.]|nr:hypothetical protein [Rhizobacter sp.]